MRSHQILLPKYRDLILPSSPMRMEGRFRLVVRRAVDDSVKTDTGWFKNIITDIGLNRIGTSNAISLCAIGTGTSTPVAGDTSLQTIAASTSTAAPGGSLTNEGTPNYASAREYGYRFNAGTLNGNYSEVGMGWASASLWSRALILNGGGSPTTITVLSSEYLDVYYMIRVVPDLATYNSTVVISGVSYSVDRKPTSVSSTTYWKFGNGAVTWCTGGGVNPTAFSGGLGAVTGSPSGASSAFDSATSGTYSNNSLEQTGIATAGLSYGNVSGGISSLAVYGSYCSYQFGFTPVIPKDNTKQLVLNGKVSWARL